MQVKLARSVVALLTLLLIASAHADGSSTEQPSLEFLEFLGEFETQEGLWVDPLSLLDSEETEKESGDEDQDDE